MNEQFDVVIVGGGPVGLWLACELKLAGTNVAVIERRAERIIQSRSLTIHGRTLETLALRGLAARFTAHGKPIPSWHFAALDTRLDFSRFETRFPYVLFIPQARTEALLEDRAVELGVVLKRGHTVERARQNGNGVVVEGRNESGPFGISALYLVGADGARSVVRREIGIEFPGIAATQTVMMGDVLVDLPAGQPGAAAFNGRGVAGILPLGNGTHHRVITLDPERRSVPVSEPLGMEELADSTRKILGADYNLRDPIWLTRFSNETRLAAAYRKERVFLAGDAAHIHAPMGGQGMNVGMQDAMNLGWKLAAVLKGHAPLSLLDSYEAERRPIGQRLHDNTLAQFALASSFDPASLALREIVSEFLKTPTLNREVAAGVSGFGIAYPERLLATSAAAPDSHRGIGVRIPDEDLQLANGTKIALYALLEKGSWLHLSFDGEHSTGLPDQLTPRQ